MKQIGVRRPVCVTILWRQSKGGGWERDKMVRKLRRLICALGVLAMLLSIQITPFAGAAESPRAVRILLSNLGLSDSLKIGIYGNYAIDQQFTFQRGAELNIRLTPQGLVLFYEGMTYFPGQHLVLKRHLAQEGLENGLRLQEGLNLYTGDLHLSAAEGKLQAVLWAPIEEYLMGVVPYEMSDDFPLEALKAQAIAARTYTLKNLQPTRSYDMTDTPNDQVYYGLNPEKTNAAQAVSQTRGIACFYHGDLAQCYYTASNGGFTESALNAWGREDIPYLRITEDRYDFQNPASEVRTASLPGAISAQAKQLNPALLKLLMDKLQPRMKALGFSDHPEDIRIEAIQDIQPHSSRYGGEQGVMRYLRFDLRVSGRSFEKAEEEISFSQPAGMTPAPGQGEGTSLSAFRNLPGKVSVDLELFPDVEAALGLSINRSSNELVHVEKTEADFVIRFTRYGHGVGLSQRGAEWMALTYGWDHAQILRFYYPGTELKQVDTAVELPAPIGTLYLTTPGPVPTATPRPTLMPVDQSKASGKPVVRVTKIPVNSSLNLRREASLNGEIIMRLFYGQELVVLEQSEDGWLRVVTDVTEGFVREEFVSFD